MRVNVQRSYLGGSVLRGRGGGAAEAGGEGPADPPVPRARASCGPSWSSWRGSCEAGHGGAGGARVGEVLRHLPPLRLQHVVLGGVLKPSLDLETW